MKLVIVEITQFAFYKYKIIQFYFIIYLFLNFCFYFAQVINHDSNFFLIFREVYHWLVF